jgi:hypothetical protein
MSVKLLIAVFWGMTPYAWEVCTSVSDEHTTPISRARMKAEALCSSEMLALTYHTTQCSILESRTMRHVQKMYPTLGLENEVLYLGGYNT